MIKLDTLCIVPCGSKKIWDKYPDAGVNKAKDVYIGSFSSKCKEYALKFYPESWCILSAKYGFIFPDEVIEGPYDVCFMDKKSNPIGIQKLKKQRKTKNLHQYNKIIVIGGNYYTKIVKEIFNDKLVENPLSNCKGIGYMMQYLNKLMNNSNKLK